MAINQTLIDDSVPYDERERPVYGILCDAREAIGRAHDLIAQACWNYSGEHNPILVGVCPKLNELVEVLNAACGSRGLFDGGQENHDA